MVNPAIKRPPYALVIKAQAAQLHFTTEKASRNHPGKHRTIGLFQACNNSFPRDEIGKVELLVAARLPLGSNNGLAGLGYGLTDFEGSATEDMFLG